MRKTLPVLAALLAVLALLAFGPPFVVFVCVRVLIAALFALAYNVVFGFGGITSLGHAAFYGIGAYAIALSASHTSGPVGVLVGLLAGAAAGALMAQVTRRTSGVYSLLLTLVVAQALWGLASQDGALTGGDYGISGIARAAPLADPHAYALAVLATCLLAAAALWVFVRSPVGRILTAARDSERRAIAFGFSPWRFRSGAFAASGCVCALAGVLHAYADGSVTPATLNWSTSAFALVASIFGGSGFFLGPALGAGVLVLLETLVGSFTEHWQMVYGIVLIATIVALPRGLVGAFVRRRRPAPSAAAAVEVTAAEASAEGSAPPGPILELENVSAIVDGAALVSDCWLRVEAGERHGLVGPNGAGKSTLFAIVCGERAATRGAVLFLGRDVTRLPPARRAVLGLGRTYQFGALPLSFTVRETMELALLAHRRERRVFWRPLRGLRALAQETSEHLTRAGIAPIADVRLRDLAPALQRLVEIVAALAARPRLLLLDEPTAGLEPEERELVVGLLRAVPRGVAMLIIEHDIEVVRSLVDRVNYMRDGRIIEEPRGAAVTP